MNDSARFIVLEGLDGAGTTTQAALLEQHFNDKKRSVVLTREPTDGAVGRFIRQVLTGEMAEGSPTGQMPLSELAMCLLFAADRVEHSRAIAAARERGDIVVSDRFVYSSIAYQSRGDEVTAQRVIEANRGVAVPDLTIFLQVPVDDCLSRLESRADAPAIYEKKDLLDAIDANYARTRDAYVEHFGPVVDLDGTMSVDDVQRAIVAAIDQHLSL